MNGTEQEADERTHDFDPSPYRIPDMKHETAHLDRRRFGQQVIAATFAGLTCTQNPSASAEVLQTDEFALNYILGSPLYGTAPLAEVVAEAKKIGAQAIDLWPRPHANHREQLDSLGKDAFRRLLRDNDVTLGMTTRYDLGPYRLADEIQLLADLGGKLIVCGAKQQPGDTLKARVANFVESMKPHVAVAETHGIVIGIENHGGNLLSSPDAIRYFADFANSPHLGLAMAPYHLPQNPSTIGSLIRHLGKSHLAFFQAWQHGKGCMTKLPKAQELLQMPGRGDLDFEPLVAALHDINYQGWTEIFMHSVPRGIPIHPTLREVTTEINRARDYLTQCVARVNRE